MSWLGDLFGSPETKETSTTTMNQLPDYAESTGARQNWWDTLQKWGTQPGYGAIAPNWGDIWNNAKAKVQRYFSGGPEGPGAVSRVKSSLAARNMSEQPAGEDMISRLYMQEGNQLQDMAVQQAVQEAQFGEQGRQNWMSQLMQLAGLKPSYGGGTTTGTSKTSGGEGWDILGGALGLGTQMFMGGQQNKMLESLLGGGGGGGTTDSGIGDLLSGDGDFGGEDMISSIAQLAPYLMMLI